MLEHCPGVGRDAEIPSREEDALSQQPGCLSVVTGEKAEALGTDTVGG